MLPKLLANLLQRVGACFNAGANDMCGTLMSESISCAVGATHGQEMTVDSVTALLDSIDRPARQRSTFYGDVDAHPEQLIGWDSAALK